MGETARTRELCKDLGKRRGIQHFPLIAGERTPPGWPDRLFSHTYCGLCLVEFKDHDTRTTPLQLRRLSELQRACICRFHIDYTAVGGSNDLVRLESEDKRTEWFSAMKLPEFLAIFHVH
jgi:hypothetical protein